MVEGIIIVQGR